MSTLDAVRPPEEQLPPDEGGDGDGAAPDAIGRLDRLAGWGALAGVVVCWLGFHGDIATHGDIGRDRFVSPMHLMIIGGLVVIWVAGAIPVLAAVSRGTGIKAAFRRVPGLSLAMAAVVLGAVSLAYDNWWHSRFGLDITLWAPAHLLLVGSFLLAALGVVIHFSELSDGRLAPWFAGVWLAVATISLLEYDLGYPHFRVLWAILALAGLTSFVMAITSLRSGLRLAATAAVGTAVVVRLVGVGFNALIDRSLPVVPVGLLAGALCFDALAALARSRRPDRRGTIVAVAAAAWPVTFLAQQAWLDRAGRVPWSATLRPEALVGGALVSAVGALAALALSRPRGDAREGLSLPRMALAIALPAAVIVLAGEKQLDPARQEIVLHGRLTEDTMAVSIPGSDPADVVSIFGRANDKRDAWVLLLQPAEPPLPEWTDAAATSLRRDPVEWQAHLDWDGERFSGTVPGESSWVAMWYTHDDRTWSRVLPRVYTGDIVLPERTYTIGAPPRAVDRALAHGVVLAFIVSAAFAVRATRKEMRR